MFKKIWLLALLVSGLPALAQNATVKGKLIDAGGKGIEAATVYLTRVKDSTIIDYTISDKSGNFSLTTRKIAQPVNFKVSFVGYQDFSKVLDDFSKDTDLGTVSMSESARQLGEVVIKTEAPPVRIKQDTLEFNASSFKVRDDANVKELLKQLPGVEITPDGKIKVNGKEVNNILVNGKPFFDKDGKIATENLPAEIIQKVQITDTKTKEEELSGTAASSDDKTINLTISEDKNKGLFGRMTAGGGSDGRYETNGLLNYFKNKRKLSVLASSNNINTTGFSMDEIFDSMGGGRNMYSSSDGSFNIDGTQFGGGKGITRSTMAGINYGDEFAKKITPTASYFFTNSENENRNVSRTQNLQNNTIEASENTSRGVNNGHNLNLEIEIKPDTLTNITIRPNFKKSNSRYTGRGSESTSDLNGNLINDRTSYNDNTTENTNFSNSIYIYRKFKKKGRGVYFYSEVENSMKDGRNLNISQTNFYANDSTVVRNQKEYNKNTTDHYMASASYSEPIQGDSLTIAFGAKFDFNRDTYNRKTYRFDGADYNVFADSLSNYLRSGTTRLNPFTRLSFKRKKYNGGARIGADFVSYRNFSDYLSENTVINRNYVFPTASVYGSYRPNKAASLYANYNFEANLPTANQLLPVENLSDPLNTIIGNPDLKPVYRHNVYLGYNNYDYASKSGFNLWSGGGYYQNQVVSFVSYDTNAKRTTTFANTDDTYDGWLGFSWNKSIKKEQNTFGFALELNSNFGLDKGITNIGDYQAKSYSLTPNVQFNYEYGELLTLTPSYSFTYSETNYDNYAVSHQSNVVHNFKLQTTSHWPKNFVYGNDFGYTYNSNIADGFKKDFFLWNMSLGYNLFKESLLAKVKVYDLLNQNINTTRTITPTSIVDESNVVLKRYVMLSLSYKIEKFAGKPKSRWEE